MNDVTLWQITTYLKVIIKCTNLHFYEIGQYKVNGQTHLVNFLMSSLGAYVDDFS